jgi:hypothetical protein
LVRHRRPAEVQIWQVTARRRDECRANQILGWGSVPNCGRHAVRCIRSQPHESLRHFELGHFAVEPFHLHFECFADRRAEGRTERRAYTGDRNERAQGPAYEWERGLRDGFQGAPKRLQQTLSNLRYAFEHVAEELLQFGLVRDAEQFQGELQFLRFVEQEISAATRATAR